MAPVPLCQTEVSARLSKALTFSRHIMVSSLSWYGYSNADFLVAGRVSGSGRFGRVHACLDTWPRFHLEKVTTIVTDVSYAYFSAVQNDSAALRRYLTNPHGGLSLIIFPGHLGLALVADDFVHLVLA